MRREKKEQEKTKRASRRNKLQQPGQTCKLGGLNTAEKGGVELQGGVNILSGRKLEEEVKKEMEKRQMKEHRRQNKCSSRRKVRQAAKQGGVFDMRQKN